MTTMREPWWIKGDREHIEQMKNAIKGKADTERVFYIGDQRGAELVSEVKAKIKEREERIPLDIARFNAAGCDYDRLNAIDDAEVARRAGF